MSGKWDSLHLPRSYGNPRMYEASWGGNMTDNIARLCFPGNAVFCVVSTWQGWLMD